MSTGEVFLGIIAVAVSVMALIQVGAIVAGVRLVRRVDEMARQLEVEIKPLLTHLTAMSSEAARAATLAASQVERLDQLFENATRRAEQTLSVAQQFIGGPAREGMAVVSGVRAAFSALRGLRESSRRRSAARGTTVEDDESLFIG
jgi:hypothetical protein